MTRGRRPINAIDEAVEIAARRGSVEQVTGKRACAFDLIIIGPELNVFVKSETFAGTVHVCTGGYEQIPTRDCEPSPGAPDERDRPGILGSLSQRDMAVFPDKARFRP